MCIFLKAGFLYLTVPIVTTGLPEACLVYNLKTLDTVYEVSMRLWNPLEMHRNLTLRAQ